MSARSMARILIGAALTWTLAATPSAPYVVDSSARVGIVVNSSDDVDDGTCDSSHCSLREALSEAWDQPGPDTITFAIPTSDPGYNPAMGVWTIRPDGGFVVHADTTVDGSVSNTSSVRALSTRPGIEIEGVDGIALGTTGLRVEDRVTLRGMIVNGFQYGIWVDDTDVVVEECYLGTDPTGTVAKPNGQDGILLNNGASGAIIQRNVISGSSGGIRLAGATTSNNIIRSNLIGCDVTGTAAIPNANHGVSVHAGAHDNVIGPGNVIAFNGMYGVRVYEAGTVGNTITQNSIHSTEWWGIVLNAGGNNGLTRPLILTANLTQVSGTACPDCTIEVFSDLDDQGAIYEGTTVADHAGNWSFTKPGGLSGPYVTATATDADGNTSEFSEPVQLLQPTPTATNTPTPTSTPTAIVPVVNSSDDVDDGTCDSTHCSLREALRVAAAQAGPDTITFAIPTSDPGYNAVTGVWTIRPDSGYWVRADTVVDGSVSNASSLGLRSTRPGIEIDGVDKVATGKTGFRVEERVTLRGLVVNRFQYGIHVAGSDVVIEDCYLGTDPSGTAAKPNGVNGIMVEDGVSRTIIQRNLISGSSGGIRLFGDDTSDNVIRNNLIGCDVTGTAPLPNSNHGVKVEADAHNNVIGPGNVIAFNGTYGVWITGAGTVGNTITRNSIHSTDWWGIRLTSGGNNELQEPIVFGAQGTQVIGTARDCPNCTIEVFSDADNEGAIYEGTTVSNQFGGFTFTKPEGLSGLYIMTTCTDGDGNTSKFSEPVRLTQPSPTATRTATPTATRTATPTATRTATPTATRMATSTATIPAMPVAVVYLPVVIRR